MAPMVSWAVDTRLYQLSMHSIPRPVIPQRGRGRWGAEQPGMAVSGRVILVGSEGRDGIWVENRARDSIERREDQTAHSGAGMLSPVR